VIDLAALAQQVPTPWAERPERRRQQGRLDELAGWLAAAQGGWPPRDPANARLVTVTDADQPADGALPAIVAAARAQDVAVVPLAVAGEDPEQTLAAGIAAADAAADEGADLIIAVGSGDPVPAITASAALANLEPTEAVVSGVDDEVWRYEVVAVRDLLRRARPHSDTPYALLTVLRSPVLSALAGLVLQAAIRRTPVVLDGLDACVAAASLYQLAPFATEWWLVADCAGVPAQRAAVDLLRLKPVFGFGTAAGYAGPLVAPLLRAAARLAADGDPAADPTADPA
jgi:nicotinate-nucleotide--dimethylbenzimidazole phosphoribosyltransferase